MVCVIVMVKGNRVIAMVKGNRVIAMVQSVTLRKAYLCVSSTMSWVKPRDKNPLSLPPSVSP